MDYIRHILMELLSQRASEFRDIGNHFTGIYFTFNLYGIHLYKDEITELNEMLSWFIAFLSRETNARYRVFEPLVKPGMIQLTANFGTYHQLEQVNTISGLLCADW
jgi:hypothetical protein